MTPVASACLNAFRSPADKKNYRLITLANGLEALLIQKDPALQHADEEEEEDEDSGGRLSVGSEGLQEPDEEPTTAPLVTSRRSRGVSMSSFRSAHDSDDSDDDDDDESSTSEADERVKHSHMAAACLTVSVGSMADPSELRGLAHYLEHMLFMGSEKYPDENEFEAFLSTHGGYSNGGTECETTRYLLEVGAAHLPLALDMFAQFFVSPLLKRDAMERELRAVESEFNRAKNNDYVRLQQVQCETCAPGHPYDSFSWGNERSLRELPEAQGIDVRERMLQFFHQHYSSHLMKLCVYGEQSLDDLEKMAVESFSAIPRRCVGPDGIDTRPEVLYDSLPPAFGIHAGQKPTLVKIVPVRKTHQMHLYWTLPPLLTRYRQKPWEYLGHVLGHEGAGSITELLRSRQWATNVTAGITEGDSYEFGSFGSLFEVNFALTRLGLQHWHDIVKVVFDTLTFLQSSEQLPAWIFDELRASTLMDHQFQEEADPLSVCRCFSNIMQTRYGIERPGDLLKYDTMQGSFDERETRALLALMTPENTRVVILSHSFEQDGGDTDQWQIERWFGAKYAVSDIPEHVLECWSAPPRAVGVSSVDGEDLKLALPEPNPFLPQSFEILPFDNEDALTVLKDAPPEVVLTTTRGSKLWYKRDATFLVPKTNASFLFCLPSVTESATNYIYAQLHLRAVYDSLKDVWYHANNAGLECDLMVRDLDIELEVTGFSDKTPEFVRVVTRALIDTRLQDVAAFTLLRDELAREYRNFNLKPAAKARYLRLQLLEREAFSIDDKLRALEEVSLEGFTEFQRRTLWQDGQGKKARLTIRALVHGNITETDAKALLLTVEDAVWTHKTQVVAPVQPLPPLLSPLVTRWVSTSSAESTAPPSPPLTPVRPNTSALPATANGLLLRDVSEHEEETNSMVEVYFQLGRLDVQDRAYADLLQQLMAEPLFHELRTTQQLGYEVHCCVRDTHGVVGFSIAVQSASHPTGEIALRIDTFVADQFPAYLERELAKTLDGDSQFVRNVTALQRGKTVPDATLGEETDRYWEEIQCRRYAFTLDHEVAAALGNCSLDGLLDRYRRWLLPSGDEESSGERKLLRVHVVGQRSPLVPIEQLVREDEVPHVIDDLRAYKRVLRCHC